MKLIFYGAARQVTGSMYLLQLDNGYRVLVDCGMDYELKRNPVEGTNLFPFEPATVDLVLLTHAHIDHSGMLPSLVHNGFKGQILCTPATADLCSFLLYDSANIQAMDYRKNLANARKTRRHLIAKPLFSEKQVKDCLERFVTLPFHKPFRISNELQITFLEAGHLLGAAGIFVEAGSSKKINIGFSGDLGRKNSKLVRDGEPFENIDYLITESTYGGRKHIVERDAETELLDYILSTCVKQRGKLVIPAFSVGRTQAIVFTIHQLKRKGLIPMELKVFVDSPLAIKSTSVYEHYHELLNEEASEFRAQYGDLFQFDNLHYLDGKDEHEELTYFFDPCVIISAAGMVEGGRIQEHVMNHIENPFSTILIAGFCAEGTLGHRLLLGQPTIKIKNKDKHVYARIGKTDVFSSHPDHDEVFSFIQSCNPSKLKKIFLVHGETPQLNAMAQALWEDGITQVAMPEPHQEFELIE